MIALSYQNTSNISGNLTITNQLSNKHGFGSLIYNIVEDSIGILYMASNRGLYKYNGYKWLGSTIMKSKINSLLLHKNNMFILSSKQITKIGALGNTTFYNKELNDGKIYSSLIFNDTLFYSTRFKIFKNYTLLKKTEKPIIGLYQFNSKLIYHEYKNPLKYCKNDSVVYSSEVFKNKYVMFTSTSKKKETMFGTFENEKL